MICRIDGVSKLSNDIIDSVLLNEPTEVILPIKYVVVAGVVCIHHTGVLLISFFRLNSDRFALVDLEFGLT